MDADTSTRKLVVERYFDGFRRGDHGAILGCLTDDVVWDIVGFRQLRGKAEFDSEIEGEQFEGRPALEVERLLEDDRGLAALGSGRGRLREGGEFRFGFCTAFEFAGDEIAKVTSYIVPLAAAAGS
jgi:ketosteroid isomerase-like protein